MDKKSGLSEAAKKARAEYQRRWREKNPEKVRRNREAYWERQARRNQQAEK